MGIIRIQGLRLQGHHGVFEQERRVGNTFEINVAVTVPAAEIAAEKDDINATVNYADIVDIVKVEMRTPRRLIETVALRIAKAIKQQFPTLVTEVTVTVAKLAPPISAQLDSVSVTLTL